MRQVRPANGDDHDFRLWENDWIRCCTAKHPAHPKRDTGTHLFLRRPTRSRYIKQCRNRWPRTRLSANTGV